MKNNLTKILAVCNFLCGTIQSNSIFWVAVLLFQPPVVQQYFNISTAGEYLNPNLEEWYFC